ncbi:MAG: hypothetical protein HY815_26325 [Candidatus Riflebacteria bacterium]|nr:hypothetical protein [Candidatus Riflebacteria bacterium]
MRGASIQTRGKLTPWAAFSPRPLAIETRSWNRAPAPWAGVVGGGHAKGVTAL